MHELLFHRQKALGDGGLRRYAVQLGLDVAAFDRYWACRRWRTGSAGTWTAAWPRARCSAPPPCSSTGFVHRGGYDPPALLAALAR